jgi:phospholipid-binding lipoprotein MlaA
MRSTLNETHQSQTHSSRASVATGGAGFVDGRANTLTTTDSLEKVSLDYYAALRSAAAQRRAALVAEGKAGLVSADRQEAPSAPGPVSVDAPATR